MRFLSLVLPSLLLVCPAQAQEFGRPDNINSEGTAYHVFARDGEATIQVVVLGAVNAGIYEVGTGTTLSQLLALTGTLMSNFEADRRRRYVLRLYRGENTQSLVYEAPLETLLTNTGSSPQLQENDVFVVDEIVQRRFNWGNLFRVVTSVSTLILVIDRLSN